MPFDRKRAEASLVEVLDGPRGGRRVGMGFRLSGDLWATACHCLPHVRGKVTLPDPDQVAPAPVLVRLREWGAPRTAVAVLLAADPCSDFALLGSPPAGLSLPEEPMPMVRLADLAASREATQLEWTPSASAPVFVYTHENRWVVGTVKNSLITIMRQPDRIRQGTSGAPVFNRDGRVEGLVGFNDVRLADANLCALADHLPGWALRRLRQAEEAGVAAGPPWP